jgi:methylated-DNA-[protein]-cysteine S-methyltransferase
MKNVTFFAGKCYSKLREVPARRVTTYGDLAGAIGSGAFRAVGSAMHNNPFAPEVPCHRVVNSDGGIGGFGGGVKKKIRMLKEEGVEVRDGKVVDFEKVRWVFC